MGKLLSAGGPPPVPGRRGLHGGRAAAGPAAHHNNGSSPKLQQQSTRPAGLKKSVFLYTVVLLYYCFCMADQSLFARYEELLRKVDLFCEEKLKKFGLRLQCRPGCALCCAQDIEVLLVEFHFLRGGLCAVYPARPVICRTHGPPLPVNFDEKEQRDCCPLNAPSLGLDILGRSGLLNFEVLNTLLGAVNLLFCRQAGIEPDRKHRLSSLLNLPQ